MCELAAPARTVGRCRSNPSVKQSGLRSDEGVALENDCVEVTDSMICAARPRWPIWTLLALAIAGGTAASLYLHRELRRARAHAAEVSAKMDEAQGEIVALRRSKAEAEGRLEKLEAQKTEIEALRDELARDVQVKDEELSRLKAASDELEEKMKAEIAKGEVRLSQANGRLTVDLVDKILFDSGHARISKRGEEVLARVGAVLVRVEDRQVQVAGHTDDAPISRRLRARYPTNWELSAARAINVVRFLEEKAHIPPARLVASGFGQFHPISPNTTARGRARNRRIEILLTPALAPAPAKLEVAKAAPAKPAALGAKAARRSSRRRSAGHGR
jgi:chemotaxis protein MotB